MSTGGNIANAKRTLCISIYNQVQMEHHGSGSITFCPTTDANRSNPCMLKVPPFQRITRAFL
jgi:hypothetical protein